MAEVIDIKEHGALDWRLREIAAALDSVRKAIDENTAAVEGLRGAVAASLESIDSTMGNAIVDAIEHQPKLGRGI